jgi:hypothetical protein
VFHRSHHVCFDEGAEVKSTDKAVTLSERAG